MVIIYSTISLHLTNCKYSYQDYGVAYLLRNVLYISVYQDIQTDVLIFDDNVKFIINNEEKSLKQQPPYVIVDYC